jgi:signal transduction histidine kinase
MGELQDLVARLRATLDRMETALGCIAEAIAWTDASGRVEGCNAAFDRLAARPHLLVLGRPLDELLPFWGKGGRASSGVFEDSRGDRPLSYEITVAGAPDGGVVVTARDITRRRDAEARVTALNRELEGQLEEVKKFHEEIARYTYAVSHDLKEPLRSVVSYTQLLAQRYQAKLGPEADEFIRYAVGAAKRMERMLSDLLAYAEVGRGDDTRTRLLERVDLAGLFTRIIIDLGPQIEVAGAKITCDSLPSVLGDESLLFKLFRTLIDNAIKFRSERPAEVHLGAVRREGTWFFVVRDNGIGIDPKYFPRLFHLFRRLHPPDKYPGTGVNLAICRKIVELHGGKIWVESEPGQGSAFHVTLPDSG